MKYIKIKPKEIDGVMNKIANNPESMIGSYVFKGIHIQVSEFRASGAKRASRLYQRRRSNGECVACGKRVTRKNKATKKLYRLCDEHRKIIDRVK